MINAKLKSLFKKVFSPEGDFCLFLALLLLPNILLSITENLGFFGVAANIILPLGTYAFLMTLSKNIGRSIWIFLPIVILSISQVVLISIYGRSVIAADMFLNLTTSNTNESGELFGSIFPIIALVAILYLPSMIAGIWMWVKNINLPDMFRRYARRLSMLLIIYGLVCVGIAGMTNKKYRVRNDLYPLNAGYNMSLAAEQRYRISDRMAGATDDYCFEATSSLPDSISELYVLVIGETSRADHWELFGYGRETNPLLSRRNNLYCFGKSLSESNTTFKSVPLLLSPLDATNYRDSVYITKSLLTAYKEVGFSTAYISSQTPNRSFIQFFSEEADTTAYINPQAKENDLIILPALDGILAEGKHKQLVVIHSYGSHFSYRDRYPREMACFVPDDYKDISEASKELLINAYDNTVRLTDMLVDGVIERVEKAGVDRCGVMFVADHGEDLYDDGRGLLLHSSPCPTFYQLHVPFFIWISDKTLRDNPKIGRALKDNVRKCVSASRSVFQTMLDLASIESLRVGKYHSVLRSSYIVPKLMFLNDHNHPLELDDCGFIDIDRRHLEDMLKN